MLHHATSSTFKTAVNSPIPPVCQWVRVSSPTAGCRSIRVKTSISTPNPLVCSWLRGAQRPPARRLVRLKTSPSSPSSRVSQLVMKNTRWNLLPVYGWRALSLVHVSGWKSTHRSKASFIPCSRVGGVGAANRQRARGERGETKEGKPRIRAIHCQFTLTTLISSVPSTPRTDVLWGTSPMMHTCQFSGWLVERIRRVVAIRNVRGIIAIGVMVIGMPGWKGMF